MSLDVFLAELGDDTTGGSTGFWGAKRLNHTLDRALAGIGGSEVLQHVLSTMERGLVQKLVLLLRAWEARSARTTLPRRALTGLGSLEPAGQWDGDLPIRKRKVNVVGRCR